MECKKIGRLPKSIVWLMACTAILISGSTPSNAQSIPLPLLPAPYSITRPGWVGYQQTGYAIGYIKPGSMPGTWGSLLDSLQPGYRLRSNLALTRSESHNFDEWNFNFAVISANRSSLLIPEALFTQQLANEILPHEGEVLLRVPLSTFVEREVNPIDSKEATQQIQGIAQVRGGLERFAINMERTLSASALLYDSPQDLNPSELDTPAATSAPVSSISRILHKWKPEFLVVERTTLPVGEISVVLPTLLRDDSNADYYDPFLAFPLDRYDRLLLLDRFSLQARIRAWNNHSTSEEGAVKESPPKNERKLDRCLRRLEH